MEEQKERLVAACSSGYVHELVVVPVLLEHALGPDSRTTEYFCQLIRAPFTDKSAEVDDGMGRLADFAVEAPFVVGVFEEFLEVGAQFWVLRKLAGRESEDFR